MVGGREVSSGKVLRLKPPRSAAATIVRACILWRAMGDRTPLFKCTGGGAVSGTASTTGQKKRRGGDGSTGYGLTPEQVEELAVRTAQLVSIHDHRLRELGTLFRQVKMPVDGPYAKVLVKVDAEWRADKRTKDKGSKHLKLAVALFEAMYGGADISEGVRKTLAERWDGKDTSTPEFLGTDVRVMKWKALKDGKHGILEFALVPGLATVEGEMVRMLGGQPGATELVGTAVKGPQVREMEQMIEGTWRK